MAVCGTEFCSQGAVTLWLPCVTGQADAEWNGWGDHESCEQSHVGPRNVCKGDSCYCCFSACAG